MTKESHIFSDLIHLLEVEKKKGKSILMSTHVLDSAEKMCDSFVILHKGQVRAKGNLQQLQEAFDMPEARTWVLMRMDLPFFF